METPNEFQTTKIWKKTLKTLKLIGAATNKSLVETVDDLANKEWLRIQEQERKRMTKIDPEILDQWADMQINSAVEIINEQGMELTPQNLSNVFVSEAGLPFSEEEAGEWLKKQTWYVGD